MQTRPSDGVASTLNRVRAQALFDLTGVDELAGVYSSMMNEADTVTGKLKAAKALEGLYFRKLKFAGIGGKVGERILEERREVIEAAAKRALQLHDEADAFLEAQEEELSRKAAADDAKSHRFDSTDPRHLQANEAVAPTASAPLEASASEPAGAATASVPPPEAPLTHAAEVGRNARCPCGSGLKFKRCHGSARPLAEAVPFARPMQRHREAVGAHA